jgi:hypothetical protein
MSGTAVPYAVALEMMGFSALSAFVLITAVSHFDTRESDRRP